MMLEKEQKKKEEEEAKEQRKLERVEKTLQRETEMKKKAEERELKAIEKKRKAAEAEAEREKKQEREMKAIERQKIAEEKQKAAEARRKQKKLKNGTQNFTKVFVTKSKSRCAPQPAKSDSDVCMVCFGNYADDLDESGTQTRDWIQCTSCKNGCMKTVLPKTKRSSIVCVCVVLFSCY